MKYLKKFESKDIKSITDLKKLIEHISKLFTELDLHCVLNYLEYLNIKEYTLSIFSKNKDIDFENNWIFKKIFSIDVNTTHDGCIILNNLVDYDTLYDFVKIYFNTIDGLEMMADFSAYVKFYIVGDVNDIIKRITKDDFQMKYYSKKYNI